MYRDDPGHRLSEAHMEAYFDNIPLTHSIVGDAEGSRFYWALVDNAIAEEADFGFYPHDQCGSFYISLVSDPDRSDEAVEIALKELEKVKHDLKDDEVQRAKNKIASSIVL